MVEPVTLHRISTNSLLRIVPPGGALVVHRISTKALLDVLPPVWAKGTNYSARLERRPIGDVILDLLRARRGYVTVAELVDYFYGDEQDGGTLGADNIIHTRIFYLRRKGHAIRHSRPHGYIMDKAA